MTQMIFGSIGYLLLANHGTWLFLQTQVIRIFFVIYIRYNTFLLLTKAV
uniref:Uncharacterized protein n=1 Tax=Colwellia sp. C1 TaxID=1737566 RepID=A0A168PI48_9GAMM|nr:hypothetical protein [Colwellia sp. C1]